MAKEITEFERMTKRGGFLDCEVGRGWSAPFTGYSWKALAAWIGLCSAWYSSDNVSRPRIEAAMREVIETFQQSELNTVRMCIYGVGNETAMLELWPRLRGWEPKVEVPFPYPYCAMCRSWHAAPRDKAHHAALRCKAPFRDSK